MRILRKKILEIQWLLILLYIFFNTCKITIQSYIFSNHLIKYLKKHTIIQIHIYNI